ncbi:MAG: MFS transporter [Anaerolineae bacterium]|nr:MFS transporter [Anaerolineae bacterium]
MLGKIRGMHQRRHFLYITFADFLVRSAYQMGKTPLLPVFALALGASEAFLGFIVSVSTLTGMLFKPLFGVLSDRGGRRRWLVIGTAFFAVMPFTYWLVETPAQLFFIRIVHGTATAIYGPVTLAYVAEQAPARRAEKLGWFGTARSAGYIVGPAAAGWLLLSLQPAAVFTVIGFISSLAFLPVLALADNGRVPPTLARAPLRQQMRTALQKGSRTGAVWLSGGLEAISYIVLYATKAFLPVYALQAGMSIALVGLFFAFQEAAHLLLRPLGGRLGDRWRYFGAIALGMALLGAALPLLSHVSGGPAFSALAVVTGAAQALIFPATVALVSAHIDADNLGAGMGIIGTLRNAGKVLGPVLGGLFIEWFDFAVTFNGLGLALLVGALLVAYYGLRPRTPRRAPVPTD